MTLLFTDSFDLHNGDADLTSRGWSLTGSPIINTSTVFETNRASLELINNVRLRRSVPGNPQSVYVMFPFRYNHTKGSEVQIFRFSDSGTPSASRLNMATDGTLLLRNATATQIGTNSTGSLAVDTWYLIQIRAMHEGSLSADQYVVWVSEDGGPFEEWINVGSGSTEWFSETITEVEPVSTAGDNSHFFSWLAVWDTTGSAPWNSDFANPYSIGVLRPTGDGAVEFVGQDADSTDNYQNVDDMTPDGDTSYNESDTVGDVDLLVLENLPAEAGEVLAVNSVAVWKKMTANAKTARQVVNISATDYEGSNVSPTTSYAFSERVMEVSPATTDPWTAAEVNGALCGYKNQADATDAHLRVTQVAVEVVYLASSGSPQMKVKIGDTWTPVPAKFNSVEATPWAKVGGEWINPVSS